MQSEMSFTSSLSHVVTMLTESLRYAVLKTRRLRKKKQVINQVAVHTLLIKPC